MKQKIILGAVFICAGILTLLIFKGNFFQPANVNLTSQKIAASEIPEEQPIREINVRAFKFGYEPNIIEATKGEKIKINIENVDVLHGIRIPDLGLRGDEVLEFTANQTGEFIWYCNNFCGEEHRSMQGKLIVKDQVTQGLNQPSAQPLQIQNQNKQSVNQQGQVFFGEKGENLILNGGATKIPSTVFESQKARFYNVVLASGKTVYFFVVKDKNGKYRAAANGCQVCFSQKKGFRQEGNEMVCNNCGNRYPLEKIATEKGGCNPAPINPDLEVKSNNVIIKQTELEGVAGLF